MNFPGLAQVWADFNPWLAGFVFLAYVVIDAMFAMYMLCVNRLQAMRAATIGAIMYFLLAFGVLNYVHNYLYLIPLTLGSWLGTYVIVLWEAHKKQKAQEKEEEPLDVQDELKSLRKEIEDLKNHRQCGI